MMLPAHLSRFIRDTRGASAAEFGLVVPVFLLFLLGTIDVGRFIWAVNENEKAAQIGARWAVATDMICSGVAGYKFAIAYDPPIPQGSAVPKDAFPGAIFPGGSATTCQCPPDEACSYPLTADRNAFLRLVGRMSQIQPRLTPDNVRVEYSWSGLGYSGDPNGMDVAPTVTVKLSRLNFRPLFLAGFINMGIPGAQYSLTMEDAQGTWAN